MGVPGDFRAGPQMGIDRGKQISGETRTKNLVEGVVEQEGEEDLVGVLGEGAER